MPLRDILFHKKHDTCKVWVKFLIHRLWPKISLKFLKFSINSLIFREIFLNLIYYSSELLLSKLIYCPHFTCFILNVFFVVIVCFFKLFFFIFHFFLPEVWLSPCFFFSILYYNTLIPKFLIRITIFPLSGSIPVGYHLTTEYYHCQPL